MSPSISDDSGHAQATLLSNGDAPVGSDCSTEAKSVNGGTSLPIDEVSTINTDVSDPHWDGYTVRISLFDDGLNTHKNV